MYKHGLLCNLSLFFTGSKWFWYWPILWMTCSAPNSINNIIIQVVITIAILFWFYTRSLHVCLLLYINFIITAMRQTSCSSITGLYHKWKCFDYECVHLNFESKSGLYSFLYYIITHTYTICCMHVKATQMIIYLKTHTYALEYPHPILTVYMCFDWVSYRKTAS